MGYIKVKDKKVVTRPIDGEKGYTMTWELIETKPSKGYLSYKGINYQLVSSVENK